MKQQCYWSVGDISYFFGLQFDTNTLPRYLFDEGPIDNIGVAVASIYLVHPLILFETPISDGLVSFLVSYSNIILCVYDITHPPVFTENMRAILIEIEAMDF